MDLAFFKPHEEAAALVRGKAAVTREVFDGLLPELRARAITVTGVEGLGMVERIRDEIEAYTRGQRSTGAEPAEAVTWDKAREQVVEILDGAGFSEAAAERRATLLLRTHGFQAYQAANWRVIQADEDTTHMQYLATEDSRVRDSHLALNGITLPKNDPFWQKHYPPWEWGCRCRARPMNPDLVEEERELDLRRKPEDRLVLEGPQLDRLRAGQIIRGELKDRDGRTVGMGPHDVTPPSEKRKEGAYQWNPGDLRLTDVELRARHEPDLWLDFVAWARRQEVAPGQTVYDWMRGSEPPRRQGRQGGSGGAA